MSAPPADVPARPRAAVARRGAAALALFALATCASAPALVLPPAAPGSPTAPGPAPRRRSFDAAELNAGCERCHADIAAEQRASLHRVAYTDATYQQQLAKEPAAFCNSCHAPEAPPGAPVPEALGHLGVGCVTCHVVGDKILAAPKQEGTDHDGEHHPLVRTPEFAGPAACAACHEFPFPDSRALLMQSTVREHAASAHAGQSCASCHMPWTANSPGGPGAPGGRHRGHTFAASRDEAFVRSAVIIEERPIEDNAFTLVLRPGDVGHAFPTGDMLRRLALTVDVVDSQGHVIQRREQYLARHFALSRLPGSPKRRILRRDDRVGATPGPLVLRHPLVSPPGGGTVHYVLRYERVANPQGDREGRPEVEGAIVLADRTLPLPALPAREQAPSPGSP